MIILGIYMLFRPWINVSKLSYQHRKEETENSQKNEEKQQRTHKKRKESIANKVPWLEHSKQQYSILQKFKKVDKGNKQAVWNAPFSDEDMIDRP